MGYWGFQGKRIGELGSWKQNLGWGFRYMCPVEVVVSGEKDEGCRMGQGKN